MRKQKESEVSAEVSAAETAAAEVEAAEAEVVDATLPDRGFLLPNQIQTDERFNVRKYEPGDPDELDRIQALAATLERDGQLDDVILVPVDDGKLVLLAGHRRRRAAALINEKRSAENKPLFRLRYQVNRDGGDLFRKAVISNVQRRDFSAMDLMLLIKRIRVDNHWEGFPGAKRVASYMGLSVATITQHERFGGADMDKDLEHRLHIGEISAQSAYDLLDVHVEKRAEVIERAQEIQHDKNIDQAIQSTETGRVSQEQAAEKLHGQKRIENPAIKQAIRETPDATDTPQPMTRKEIVEFFMKLDSPVYGGHDGAVRQWLAALEKLIAGTAGRNGEKVVIAKFDVMVKGARKGTLDGEEKSQFSPKTQSGKQPRRDKGSHKTKATSTPPTTMRKAPGKTTVTAKGGGKTKAKQASK